MNKLTELEIVKIFSHYPECPVLIFDSICPYCEKPLSETAVVKRQCNHCNKAIDGIIDPVPDNLEGVIYDLPQVISERISMPPAQLKLVLKPLHHLGAADIVNVCRCYSNTGFMLGKTVTVVDDYTPGLKKVVIDGSPYVYTFDVATGTVAMYNNSRAITRVDNQGMVTQWYFDNGVAIPLYFEPGHWARGKTAIELGVAVPSRQALQKLLKEKLKNDPDVADWFFDKKLRGVNLYDLKTLDLEIEKLKNG